MKLRATFMDIRTRNTFGVTIKQFKNKYGNKTYIDYRTHQSIDCIIVLVDDGYTATFFYYPLDSYRIISLFVINYE